MYYHSQNLSADYPGTREVSKFWHGRAWLHGNHTNRRSREYHWEWGFGKYARDFSATISFGNGDDDAGLLIHLCIPYIFSLFFGISGVYRCKECACGVAIHNGSIWFYPLSYRMDSPKENDPWYRHHYAWSFPWEMTWYSTEILGHVKYQKHMPVLWREDRKNRKPFFDSLKEREEKQQRGSRDYPYAYILRNREIQNRTATVFVERREWRAKWWPIIPMKKSSVCISVSFNEEVGEGTGSWKGGTTGCGYEMKWGETPERCLSRMEHEREFKS